MGLISFVVVGTPRSGTGFTSKLFNALGVPCGHEQYFTTSQQTILDSNFELFGDSSWLAAPFLQALPPNTRILHQVRNPLATIDSLLFTGHLQLDLKANPYIDFIKRHTPFPSSLLTPLERAVYFWWYWNRLIEMGSAGKPYHRYQLETLNPEELMCEINQPPSGLFVEAALAVPKNYNTRGKPPLVATATQLSPEARNLAEAYGYNLACSE